MRHRRAYLVFPDKHGIDPSLLKATKLLAGLNIGFNIKITSGVGQTGNANITVYNLNREDMEFLSTCAAKWEQQKALVQLFVGYDDDVRCVFSGWISQATPEGYPDLALNIKGLTGQEWWTKTIDITKADTSMMDLIDYASSASGYPVNITKEVRQINQWLNKRLENFSYTGTSWGLMDKIQEMLGDGFMSNKNGVMLSTYNDQTFVYTPESGSSEGNTLYISEKTGMIGVPHPTSIGVDITMLLNTKVNIGDKIRLETKRMPIINGDYYISQFSHIGELRGNTWQTTIRCSQSGQKPRQVNQGSITQGLGG